MRQRLIGKACVIWCTSFCQLFAWSQDRSVQAQWTFNFQSAPLEINEIGKRVYTLTNKAGHEIVAYSLGCVADTRSGHPNVVFRMAKEETHLKPSEEIQVIAMHNSPDRALCERRESKLTVAEVYFESGKIWRAAPGS